MKKLATFLTIMAVALAQSAISQDITLRFTGATTDGFYMQLDSVKVQNVSRSWSETVVYPDTVLTFTNVGIAEVQSLAAELSAYPNPFNGTTNVAVTLPQSGNALLQLFNLAGQKVAEGSFELQAGNSLFEVRLQNPQLYLLAVTTPQGHSTIKLLNRRAGERNGISFRGMGNVMDKRQSAQPFHSGDELLIMGYASDPDHLCVSRQVRQTQTTSENFTLIFDTVPEGAVIGVFSVDVNKRVLFSNGNLQYLATGTHAVAGGGTAPGTWRFALNQYDTIGAANANISSSYNGWIDLFGWGTSGWNSGATAYQPYSTSTDYSDYLAGNSETFTLTGAYANADWGVYNAISNGGNQPGMWRTLTNSEWCYLLFTRTTPSGILFANATVNGIKGAVIVPDNWDNSVYTLDTTGYPNISFSQNVISNPQWVAMERAGCVFFPAGGNRNGTAIWSMQENCIYWSASRSYSSHAYAVLISEDAFDLNFNYTRHYGCSVRLVRDL